MTPVPADCATSTLASPEDVILSLPAGSLIVLANVGVGTKAAPLILRARDRGVRVLCTDRWKRCLSWIGTNSPQCFGSFALYAGTIAQAAAFCAPRSLDAVFYLRGLPSYDDRVAWAPKLKESANVWAEGWHD